MAKSDADVVYTPTLSAVLDALSDATRRQLVYRLSLQPGLCNSFGDLGSKTKLSYHYAVLRRAGLTRTEKQGTWRMMHLRQDEVEELFPGLLSAVLKGASSERPPRDAKEPPVNFHDEDCSCEADGASAAAPGSARPPRATSVQRLHRNGR